jgi:hypothetical protein
MQGTQINHQAASLKRSENKHINYAQYSYIAWIIPFDVTHFKSQKQNDKLTL